MRNQYGHVRVDMDVCMYIYTECMCLHAPTKSSVCRSIFAKVCYLLNQYEYLSEISCYTIWLMSNLNKPDQKTSKWQNINEMGEDQSNCNSHGLLADFFWGGGEEGNSGNHCSHLQY